MVRLSVCRCCDRTALARDGAAALRPSRRRRRLVPAPVVRGRRRVCRERRVSREPRPARGGPHRGHAVWSFSVTSWLVQISRGRDRVVGNVWSGRSGAEIGGQGPRRRERVLGPVRHRAEPSRCLLRQPGDRRGPLLVVGHASSSLCCRRLPAVGGSRPPAEPPRPATDRGMLPCTASRRRHRRVAGVTSPVPGPRGRWVPLSARCRPKRTGMSAVTKR
jgi:hypothetical protein